MNEFRRMAEAKVDHDRHFKLLNTYPSLPNGERDWSWNEDFYRGKWWEIEKEEWEYFLNVLPPIRWTADWFAMSELQIGSITGGYFRIGKRYFHCYVDLSEPDVMAATFTYLKGQMAKEPA